MKPVAAVQRHRSTIVTVVAILGGVVVAVSFGFIYIAMFVSIGIGMTCEKDCGQASSYLAAAIGQLVLQMAWYIGALVLLRKG